MYMYIDVHTVSMYIIYLFIILVGGFGGSYSRGLWASRKLEKTEVGATVASRALQEPSRRPEERSKSPRDDPKSALRAIKTAPRAF